jgi:hypothetical protein
MEIGHWTQYLNKNEMISRVSMKTLQGKESLCKDHNEKADVR